MAIVTCPQCGKPVSSKAKKCPHCGFVLQSVTELRQLKRVLIPIVSVCIVAILVILLYLNSNNKSSSISSSYRKQTDAIIEKCVSAIDTKDMEEAEDYLDVLLDDRTLTNKQMKRVEKLRGSLAKLNAQETSFESMVVETELETDLPSITVNFIDIDTIGDDNLSMDTIVEEVLSEDSTIQLQPVVEQPQEQPAKSKVSKLDLGYAIYEPIDGSSGIKNGQPHGNGIMRFKSRQTIPGTVDCVADPGEWVNGMWRDGKVNAGTWYRNDGNQVIVKLGQRYNK